MISFTLCDPGDGIIIPSPYYPGIASAPHSSLLTSPLPSPLLSSRALLGFDLDLNALAGVVPIPAYLQSSNNFDLDIAKLQEVSFFIFLFYLSLSIFVFCLFFNHFLIIFVYFWIGTG